MNNIKLECKVRIPNSNILDERPTFYLKSTVGFDIPVLYDTGAQDSVWCNTLKQLQLKFPDVKSTKGKSILHGFGGFDNTPYPVYIIPKIKLGTLILLDLPVILKPSRFDIDLILQSSAFALVDFKISFRNKVLFLEDSKPIRFRPYLDNNLVYQGSYVFFEESTNSPNLPVDLLEYSKHSGKSVDAIAQEIYRCMPDAMKDSSLSVLENALLEWDTFKKFL